MRNEVIENRYECEPFIHFRTSSIDLERVFRAVIGRIILVVVVCVKADSHIPFLSYAVTLPR
jgi:hypothetical protein